MTASEQKLKQRYVDAKNHPSCKNCIWMKEFYSDRLKPTKSVFSEIVDNFPHATRS